MNDDTDTKQGLKKVSRGTRRYAARYSNIIERMKKGAVPTEFYRYARGHLERAYTPESYNGKAAKDMGMHPSDLTRRLQGGRKWQADEIVKLQNIIKRPIEEIIGHMVPDIPLIIPADRVHVAGHVGVDGVVVNGPGSGPKFVLPPPRMLDAQAIVVEAPGTAMDRWVIYYGMPIDTANSVIGQLCIVRRKFHNDVVIGLLRKGSQPDLYAVAGFMGFAPAYQETRLLDVARVEWVQMP